MELQFLKMQGAGNDFVVLNNLEHTFTKEQLVELTPRLCNRRFGIGADGLMALHPPEIAGTHYSMIYRNADGSDAGMCGNGARCLAAFAAKLGFKGDLSFSMHKNVYTARILEEGVSILFPDTEAPTAIHIEGKTLLKLRPGTEHVVLKVSESALKNKTKLTQKGRKIRYSPAMMPVGCNVNFMAYNRREIKKNRVQLHTYERGVEGLTLACGTGAIATAIAAHHTENAGKGNHEYTIKVTGGTLTVKFNFNKNQHKYQHIELIGEAAFVYEGRINI